MSIKQNTAVLRKDDLHEEGEKTNKRLTTRSYPVVEIPIYDVDDPTIEGIVTDISSEGIQISDIPVQRGGRKTLFIQTDDFDAGKPFSFDVECRWVKVDNETGACVAGFEILCISEKDLERLQRLISSFTFSDL